jgi:hypothetical protein
VLRVAVKRAGRCRIVEGGEPLWVGADGDCDVRLEGRTVLARHASLHERRGEAIVTACGSARVVVRGEVIRAPVVVTGERDVGIAGYALRVAVVPDDRSSWVGRDTEVGRVVAEMGDRERGVRRYLTADGDWEIAEPLGAAGPSWWRRVEAAYPDGRALEGGAFAAPRPAGRSAAELMYAVERGWLRLPAEALVVVAVRVLEDLERWGGVHGGVWPERVALGRRGEVRLLPPGPDPEPLAPLTDAFSSPARRLKGAESPADDRFALRTLLERLDPSGRRPAWLDPALAEGPFSILEHASRASLDATAQHVARVVRVLDAALDAEA